MKVLIIILFSMLILSSCTSFIRFTSTDNVQNNENKDSDILTNEYYLTDEKFIGLASFYHNKFQGRKTANGEIYNKNDFTAAHRTLPFGTLLFVTNLENHKTVVVRINDRGPFVKGRVLDLSRAAAEKLEMIHSGVVKIEAIIINEKQ